MNDIDDETYRLELATECRKMVELLKREEDMAGMFQDERSRMNYFWIVAKKNLEDKQAELRNKEREFQDLKEKHQIELKVYRQR